MIGSLPCCSPDPCWKARVIPLGDKSGHDGSLCERPTQTMGGMTAECMAKIRPDEVASAVLRHLGTATVSKVV